MLWDGGRPNLKSQTVNTYIFIFDELGIQKSHFLTNRTFKPRDEKIMANNAN